MILCAEAAEKIGKIFPILPTREFHVRALLALESDEHRAEVWKTVSGNGHTITAQYVSDEVAKFKARLEKNWLTLDEWNALTTEAQREALTVTGQSVFDDGKFNAQSSDSIEWARFSWNPITGCRHGCKYCYARDIAARFYPHGFLPTIHPSRLSAPSNMKPAQEQPEWTAEDRMGHKNVFVCSMADLFGKWVPASWIEAVLDQIRKHKEWNFLLLTKFPTRMAEFEFPKNAWVGASVDTQGAVGRAEKAFKEIKAGVKWLSCEPMMERLTFSSLEMFDWVVIGGSSQSSEHAGSDTVDASPATPEFRPPFEWIAHLHAQAKQAKCKVYMKTNLLGERVREYPI
jgi:protein gp37